MFIATIFFLVSVSNTLFGQSNTKQNSIYDSIKKVASSIQFNNPDSAIILYSNLCKYYQSEKNLYDYYSIQIRLASCYSIQQKNIEALKVYDDCTKYFSEKKDSVKLYSVYSGIAGVCYNLNDNKKTIQYLEMSEKVCNPNKYPDLKFISLLNLENCFLMTNQYDSAFKCCEEANKILKFTKDPTFGYQLKSKLALLYYLKHQYNLSIDNARSALSLNKNRDKRLSMDSYKAIGLCYLDTKNYALSDLYLDSALMMSKFINSKKEYCEILQNKFRVDTLTHNYKRGCENLLNIIDAKDSLFETNKNSLTNELLVKFQTEKKEAENRLLEVENTKRTKIIKWQQVLIVIIIILSIAIIGILFFYFRNRNRQQKKAIEKDRIDAELKALKAQLNPHFIQNIFQIISNQVRINPSEVEVFLQKTASYFRSVLNGTDKSVQSLEDEMIFTEKYLQFQQSLFRNKLIYNIEIADNVDTFGIMVPSMLLQPFIENSVKHGLQLSQKAMSVDIKCFKDDKYLYIEIVDTGNFVVDETIINDKSFGNALIIKRLHLFYKNSSKIPKLFANPVDGNNGFKVEISLPL